MGIVNVNVNKQGMRPVLHYCTTVLCTEQKFRVSKVNNDEVGYHNSLLTAPCSSEVIGMTSFFSLSLLHCLLSKTHCYIIFWHLGPKINLSWMPILMRKRK